MGDPLLVSQELIDVLAVRLQQILAIPDSHHHGVQCINIKAKKETGKADEIGQVLPKATRGRNR
jgi:hypothetical protein